ncbi:MAG: hypothetical protein ACFUZC_21875 [Chthoniobacteraceae bacterium]
MLRPVVMAGVVIVALTKGSAAIGGGSFSDSDIEVTEAKVTLQTVTAENEVLKRQLGEAKDAIKSLTESLAVSNGEAEVFRREAADLKLRMTALGVDGLSGDKSKLEQRLLKAVRDLQLVQGEKDKLAEELVQLSEAVLRFTKVATTDDAEARMALEARMRSAEETLGVPGNNTAQPSNRPGSLNDGMVVSIKEDLSLVVANIGSQQGVRVAMPLKVIRDGRIIGLVRVVDVREKICGAVIQSLDSEKNKIKVGDRLMVDTQ